MRRRLAARATCDARLNAGAGLCLLVGGAAAQRSALSASTRSSGSGSGSQREAPARGSCARTPRAGASGRARRRATRHAPASLWAAQRNVSTDGRGGHATRARTAGPAPRSRSRSSVGAGRAGDSGLAFESEFEFLAAGFGTRAGADAAAPLPLPLSDLRREHGRSGEAIAYHASTGKLATGRDSWAGGIPLKARCTGVCQRGERVPKQVCTCELSTVGPWVS